MPGDWPPEPTEMEIPMTCQRPTLTHERLQEILNYDPETGIFRWRARVAKRVAVGDIAGSPASGYQLISINNHKYRGHRLAWFYMTGEWPVGEVDHINGDKSDNSFKNLRDATPAENRQNRPPRKDNTSGVTGVTWSEPKKRWLAFVSIGNKQHFLGHFLTKDKAIAARRAAAVQHYGQFVHPSQLGGM